MQTQRKNLELQAAAVLELRKRRSKEKTVYGMVCPNNGLVRCWQEQNGVYVEVDKPPVVSVPIKLEPAIIIPKPIKLIDGGRGGGKSESVASIMSARAKDYKHKIACFREFQNSISDSVHSLISRKIQDHGFQDFDVQEARILLNGEDAFKFRGIARNPEGVKSMDAFDDFWVEEAQTISGRSLELIEPTLRRDGSEIWYTLNRKSSADPISQEHLKPYDAIIKDGYYEDDQIMIIIINWWDNPWFPDNLNGKRLKNKKLWSAAKYEHVWNGGYSDEVDGSIIKMEWFNAAIDAHKKMPKAFTPSGARIAAHDPSDTGNDAKGYSLRHGSIFEKILAKDTGEIDEGCDWATGQAIKDNADWFVWDGDGMGAGLKRQVSIAFNGKATKYHMFRGSLSGIGQDNAKCIYMPVDEDDKSDNPKTYSDTFKNNRAQYYWLLRDRFYNTYRCIIKGEYIDPVDMISIDSDGVEQIDKLRAEICRVPEKPNNVGLIQIMTKKEMKALEIDSPNMADSMMMNLYQPSVKKVRSKLNYPPTGSV